MKLFLSYLLVGAFVFLAAPKDYFHHHHGHVHFAEEDHDHDHDHDSSDHSEKSFDEDCFVCDIDYSTFSATVQLPLRYQQRFFSEQIRVVKSWKLEQNIVSKSTRGPPFA